MMQSVLVLYLVHRPCRDICITMAFGGIYDESQPQHFAVKGFLCFFFSFQFLLFMQYRMQFVRYMEYKVRGKDFASSDIKGMMYNLCYEAENWQTNNE